MFNLLLVLLTGFIIGWNFHAFYSALGSPKIIYNDINISQENSFKHQKATQKEINISNIIEKTTHLEISEKDTISNIEHDNFYTLLDKNLFSDALSLYLDAEDKEIFLYRSKLNEFFKIKSSENPKEAITQMVEYLEIEPSNNKIKEILIETYKFQKNYKKAIELLINLMDNSSDMSEEIEENILITSQKYIDKLNDSKKYMELRVFLESLMEHDFVPFSTFELAKYHINMEQYSSAIRLLKEIEFNEEYESKVKNLFEEIEKKITISNEYSYQLPLNKSGSHYTVKATIDNTPLTLLIDTGATLTMINENKTLSLNTLNEYIKLNTAGGEIIAQLKEATTFKVGEIELRNFKVTTSSFKQKNVDGLLGMDFLNKFKFKIDQEKNILYLSEK